MCARPSPPRASPTRLTGGPGVGRPSQRSKLPASSIPAYWCQASTRRACTSHGCASSPTRACPVKAQRLDRQLATQFLPLIKDVTTREICAQHSAGRFSEIVHVLIECVGLRRTRTKPELSDGHANASSTDQEPEVDDDRGMHFRTAKGGKMQFRAPRDGEGACDRHHR